MVVGAPGCARRASTGMSRFASRSLQTIILYQAYYFARDDRVYRAFVERLDRHKDAIQLKVGRRLRWQLRVLRTQLEGRNRTYRVGPIYLDAYPRPLTRKCQSKVESLARELDEGEGV